MLLLRDAIESLAHRLYDARKSRTSLRHYSAQNPGMTLEDGYLIQRSWVKCELADEYVIRGRKIRLTSRAMESSSQITEPDYAPFMDDMFFDTGTDISIERFISPRVEVEPVFVLGRPLKGPGMTLFEVIQATEYVRPVWFSAVVRPSRIVLIYAG